MRALFIFAMWKVKIVYDSTYGISKTVYKCEVNYREEDGVRNKCYYTSRFCKCK